MRTQIKPILSFLHVNSAGNLEVIALAETKIDQSFPTVQFTYTRYRESLRLDII